MLDNNFHDYMYELVRHLFIPSMVPELARSDVELHLALCEAHRPAHLRANAASQTPHRATPDAASGLFRRQPTQPTHGIDSRD